MASVVHPLFPGAERELELPAETAIAVEIPEDQQALDLAGARITPLADGGVEVDFEPGALPQGQGDPNDHYANIAEFLTEGQRNTIAMDVIEMVEADIQSRQPWFERFARGLELIGVKDEQGVKLPFTNASQAVHPLIAEAIIQFQARALKELFPAKGPAKAIVMGERTREKEEQAERVKDYQNYQLTVEDETYYPESDQLLWLVGFAGNVFRKCYNDPFTGKNVARLIHADELVVPYRATTLVDAPRFTHMIPYSQHEMRRLQASGFFMQTPLQIPSSTPSDNLGSPVQEAKDQAEGKTDPDARDEDREHTVFEMNVFYDVPGFEDEDGIALPWLISVEKDSMKTLAIRRGWREGDAHKKRRMQIAHYPFIRGDGFYAYGLIHLAGGLGMAATGALRVILDNAAFAALQGGFKAKDGAKIPGSVTMEPGKYIETEASYEELEKAFFNPPFHPVPEAMFRVLGLLTEMGQRFVNTTEATVGDASNTGPVGTTVALIEQGSKVHSGVHSRLHVALGHELKYLAELNGEYLPDEGYPYEVPGASRMVYKADFDSRVDVIPVSDPNIFSQTQRIAMAQTTMQLADAAPDLYDRRAVHRRFHEAIGTYEVDEILIEREKIPRCDPVTENALAIVGRPVKAFLDQDHDAHVAVHLGQLQLMAAQGATGVELFQQIIMPHVAEHQALGMRLKMMQQIGLPLPPLKLDAKHDEPVTVELPPELENQVAVQAAKVTQALLQQLKAAMAQPQGRPAGKGEGEDPAAEEARKQQAFEAEERRKDIKVVHDAEREDAKAGIDPAAVRQASLYVRERGLEGVITPRRLAVVSRELGRSFDETVRLLMRASAGGQGLGPAEVVMPTIRR